jgi:hypothetical protein
VVYCGPDATSQTSISQRIRNCGRFTAAPGVPLQPRPLLASPLLVMLQHWLLEALRTLLLLLLLLLQHLARMTQ